ncbi:MAG: alcohol dehydrogenase catalytic domain-containing protein [Mycetocola sp.]
MKAIRYVAPGDFPVVEIPNPRPGPHEILVRPRYVGLCFTDKHSWDGLTGGTNGMVGGHEFSAEIVELGTEVEGPPVGTLVSVDPRLYCGQCRFCAAGLQTRCVTGPTLLGVSAHCDGGLADLCVVPEYAVYVVPDGVTALAAACVEPKCCATRAARNAGVRIGDNALVLGCEDYGLFVTGWLRAAGVNEIIAVDPSEMRRSAATEMGADLTLSSSSDYLDAVSRKFPAGADIVFVNLEDYIVDSEMYLENAFLACRTQGKVVVLRAYGPAPYANLHSHPAWLKEIELLHFGNFFGNEPLQGGRPRGDWQVTLDALADGRVQAPTPGATVVDFSAISGSKDFVDIFASIPERTSKVLIRMS